jgi:K+-sensing histidine kinase KdpD
MSHDQLYEGVRLEPTGGRPGLVHVVGIDGTTSSLAALRYALEQAYSAGGEVHAVYAYTDGVHETAEELARTFADQALEALPLAMREAGSLLVTASEGDPTTVLLAAARGAGSVVVGAPRSLRDSAILGETVSACLVAGGLPVTLVPAGWTPAHHRTENAVPAGATA